MRRLAGLVAIAALALAIALPAPVAAARKPTVTISAMTPPAFRTSVTAAINLTASATLRVEVRDFDGGFVVRLRDGYTAAGTIGVTWDGGGVLDGPYTIVATAGSSVASLAVARWSTLPELYAPSSMVVVLDPGHGGTELGASYPLPDGTLLNEKTVNLDLARRVERMLRAAGVTVYLTRTTDSTVPLYDRTTYSNDHRADVFVSLHNNANGSTESGVMGLYCGTGCRNVGTSRNLADRLVASIVNRMAPLNSASYTMVPLLGPGGFDDYLWWVNYRGCTVTNPTIGCHFAVLGPYDPTVRPKAIMATAVLLEHLNEANPTERLMLSDPSVRGRLAAADADAIAAWFANRTVGAQLTLAASLPTLTRNRTAYVSINVVNNGKSPIAAGSSVVIGDRSRVSGTDNSGTFGTTIGTASLASGLAPGAAVTINVPVYPTVCGDRTWKADFVVGGVRVTSLRTPPLQLQVSVVC